MRRTRNGGSRPGAGRGRDEREVRLVGTDISERAIGRQLCDSFHLVPRGGDPEFAEAVRHITGAEEVDVVLPQSSFDLERLAERREDFGEMKVLV